MQFQVSYHAPTDCEIEILDIEADFDARKSELMTDEPDKGREDEERSLEMNWSWSFVVNLGAVVRIAILVSAIIAGGPIVYSIYEKSKKGAK